MLTAVTAMVPVLARKRKGVGFMTFPLAIVRAAGFFGVLAIIVLSLVPGADRPHTGLPGMVEHFIAYCFTASALAFGFRTRAAWIAIALGLTLLATSMEVLQLWVPGRHSAISDAIISSFGGLLGVALGGVAVFGLVTPRHSMAP
jgi:O-antigen ligase